VFVGSDRRLVGSGDPFVGSARRLVGSGDAFVNPRYRADHRNRRDAEGFMEKLSRATAGYYQLSTDGKPWSLGDLLREAMTSRLAAA
jgi:hypothetical protein